MAYVRPVQPPPCHCGAPATVEIINVRRTMAGYFCDGCKVAELQWLAIEEEILRKFCREMIDHGAPQPDAARRAFAATLDHEKPDRRQRPNQGGAVSTTAAPPATLESVEP